MKSFLNFELSFLCFIVTSSKTVSVITQMNPKSLVVAFPSNQVALQNPDSLVLTGADSIHTNIELY